MTKPTVTVHLDTKCKKEHIYSVGVQNAKFMPSSNLVKKRLKSSPKNFINKNVRAKIKFSIYYLCSSMYLAFNHFWKKFS
jgi:hypothetical protein